MQTMTDFIKNKSTTLQWQGEVAMPKIKGEVKQKVVTVPKIEPQNPDTFEKQIEKEEKKIRKYYKVGATAIGTALAVTVAYVKRKNITKVIDNTKETVKTFVKRFKKQNPVSPNADVNVPIQPQKPPVKPVVPPQPQVVMTVNNLAEEISKTEIKDIPKIVAGIANGTKDEQETLLKVYLKLIRQKGKLPKNSPQRDVITRKSNVIECQMIDKNISFIPNVKIKPSDIANEKNLVWKLKRATRDMAKNEASLLAGLEWVEKNGKHINEIDFSTHMTMTNTMLDHVTLYLREDIARKGDVTDKVLNKYLDVFEKYAKKWEKYGFLRGDSSNLEILFEENAKNLSKETAFRFLDVFERKATTNNQSYSFMLNVEKLNIDGESKAEMLRRLEILDKKLPRFEKKK